MTSKLAEWHITWKLSENVCLRLTRRVIRDLQELRNGIQSGDDSVLISAWDEICVQVQGQESVMWDLFDRIVRDTILGLVTQLEAFEREAIWLQTQAGKGWEADDEESRDEYPVIDGDIVDYVTSEYVYSAAANWSNLRIRRYLAQNSGSH